MDDLISPTHPRTAEPYAIHKLFQCPLKLQPRDVTRFVAHGMSAPNSLFGKERNENEWDVNL